MKIRLRSVATAFGHVCRLPPPKGRTQGRGQFPATAAAEGDIAQIILLSGTTGPAKAVPLTWATIAQRTGLRDKYFPIDGPVLSLMQPGTAGGLQTCLTALTHGLMVDLSTDIAALVATSADPDMRYVIGSPSQLATLIKAMDLVDARAPYIRACLVMGGAVSPHLQQAAARIFGGSVMAHMGLPNLAPVRAMWPRSSLRTATGLKF